MHLIDEERIATMEAMLWDVVKICEELGSEKFDKKDIEKHYICEDGKDYFSVKIWFKEKTRNLQLFYFPDKDLSRLGFTEWLFELNLCDRGDFLMVKKWDLKNIRDMIVLIQHIVFNKGSEIYPISF